MNTETMEVTEKRITMPLARAIASALEHVQRLGTWDTFANPFNWTREHFEAVKRDAELRLQRLCKEHLPSGSGIDAGSQLSDNSKPNRLVFDVSFHHMDECGMYDGWTDHAVIVTADLTAHDGFTVRVTGRDRNDIKEYLRETFDQALAEHVDPYPLPATSK